MTNFRVVRDQADYLVIDASISAHSFAMVPKHYRFAFTRADSARKMADVLNKMDNVELTMIETPDRFEAVADTLYGVPWGSY